MSETLFAAFRDPTHARAAAELLVDRGVWPSEISLRVNDLDKVEANRKEAFLDDIHPTTPMRGTEFRQLDPMGEDMRQLSVPHIDRPLDPEIGGLLGWLFDNGMLGESAQRYLRIYEDGGAILAITLTRPESKQIASEILGRMDPSELETHSAYMA